MEIKNPDGVVRVFFMIDIEKRLHIPSILSAYFKQCFGDLPK